MMNLRVSVVRRLVLATASLALASTIAAAEQDSASSSALSFVTQATFAGRAEIELSELALKYSQDQQIREFARRMVKDHTAADERLDAIAARYGLARPEGLDAEQKAVRQKLAELRNDEFDTAYGAEMASGHDEAVKLFEAAARDKSFPEELRNFAASTLPTLKQHEQMAHALHGDEEDTASR